MASFFGNGLGCFLLLFIVIFFRNFLRLSVYFFVRLPGVSSALFRISQIALDRNQHFRLPPGQTPVGSDEQVENSGTNEELTVAEGVCRGLRYPRPFTHGSIFEGKLAGTYESEIHSLLEKKLHSRGYRVLVDIGSAEGYYAVGLALRAPAMMVYAFDTEPLARRLLAELAAHNGVADRVFPCALFAPHTFSVFAWEDRSLVICDCEGYEAQLFGEDAVSSLAETDLLIELHQQETVDIREKLEALFRRSHRITYIPVTPPIEKFLRLRPTTDAGISNEALYRLVDEQRTQSFGWLFLEAK